MTEVGTVATLQPLTLVQEDLTRPLVLSLQGSRYNHSQAPGGFAMSEANGKKCAVENCAAQAISRGWCGKHYQRWMKHGDPLLVVGQRGLVSTIDVSEDARRIFNAIFGPDNRDNPVDVDIESLIWLVRRFQNGWSDELCARFLRMEEAYSLLKNRTLVAEAKERKLSKSLIDEALDIFEGLVKN